MQVLHYITIYAVLCLKYFQWTHKKMKYVFGILKFGRSSGLL